MVVRWCFCGGVGFGGVFCGGVVAFLVVVFLWWCGGVFVLVFLCFCGGVLVFLWCSGILLRKALSSKIVIKDCPKFC